MIVTAILTFVGLAVVWAAGMFLLSLAWAWEGDRQERKRIQHDAAYRSVRNAVLLAGELAHEESKVAYKESIEKAKLQAQMERWRNGNR